MGRAPMGARHCLGYDGSSYTTIAKEGGRNDRNTLVPGFFNPGQGVIRLRTTAVALVVHERSSTGVRLPWSAGTYLVRLEIGCICGQLLQPAHPRPVRRSTPTSWSMASSIAATTREKSAVQLVSDESGRSGRSVITQPPMKTNSRLANSSVSRADRGWLAMAHLLGGGCGAGELGRSSGELGPDQVPVVGAQNLPRHSQLRLDSCAVRHWDAALHPVTQPLRRNGQQSRRSFEATDFDHFFECLHRPSFSHHVNTNVNAT